jgi:hypothetical protein
MVKVKAGILKPFSLRPYAYGKFPTAWSTKIGSGTVDTATGLIYLSLNSADTTQGEYANPPIIVAYSAKASGSSIHGRSAKKMFSGNGSQLSLTYSMSSESETQFTLATVKNQSVKCMAYDAQGNLLQILFKGQLEADSPVSVQFSKPSRGSGIYFIRLTGDKTVLNSVLPLLR